MVRSLLWMALTIGVFLFVVSAKTASPYGLTLEPMARAVRNGSGPGCATTGRMVQRQNIRWKAKLSGRGHSSPVLGVIMCS